MSRTSLLAALVLGCFVLRPAFVSAQVEQADKTQEKTAGVQVSQTSIDGTPVIRLAFDNVTIDATSLLVSKRVGEDEQASRFWVEDDSMRTKSTRRTNGDSTSQPVSTDAVMARLGEVASAQFRMGATRKPLRPLMNWEAGDRFYSADFRRVVIRQDEGETIIRPERREVLSITQNGISLETGKLFVDLDEPAIRLVGRVLLKP